MNTLHPVEKKAWLLHRAIAVVALIGLILLTTQVVSIKTQEFWVSSTLATLLILRVGVEIGFGYASRLRRKQIKPSRE